MSGKWHGSRSVPRQIKGGGPQRATLSILESNNSAECVSDEHWFKFVDDLTFLEIINHLTIGISPFYLKSSQWLDSQPKINEKKTKTMLFNFTEKYQFSTRLQLNGRNVEVIDQTRLLGTIILDDLKRETESKSINFV